VTGSLVSSYLAGLLLMLGDMKPILFYLGLLLITVIAVGGVKLCFVIMAINIPTALAGHR